MQKLLDISLIEANEGQVPGLPANPRTISDESFQKLKRSIEDFPEMLKLREIVVFPFDGKYVCIGGNMRLRACRELGHRKMSAKMLKADFPIEKLREFVIKDNAQFGESDLDRLLKDWSTLPLDDWGLAIPDLDQFVPNFDPETSYRKITAEEIVKTQKELEESFLEPENYKEVICPHCAETFFIKAE